MGGGDKGLADVAGQPMLAHVVARLRPQVDALVLNANGDPARFAGFGLPVVEDTMADFPGPLAGVLAGLRWALAHTASATHVVSAPGDAPLLPRDFVAKLALAAEGRPGAIAVAMSDGQVHPVIALWPLSLADDLEQALRDGLRQVRRFIDRHGAAPVPFAAVDLNGHAFDPFFNANTPEDLAALRSAFAAGAA